MTLTSGKRLQYTGVSYPRDTDSIIADKRCEGFSNHRHVYCCRTVDVETYGYVVESHSVLVEGVPRMFSQFQTPCSTTVATNHTCCRYIHGLLENITFII